MPTLVDILFLCLLFEPERIVFNPLFCPFNFLPSIIHLIVFILFTFFIFHRATRENKLVYNKKQLQLLVLFLFLSIIYCMYFYFNRASFYNFGLKVKLVLWCFYLIALKQYFAMVNPQKLFKMIGIILFVLTIIALPWSLGIHGPYLSSSKDLINHNTFPYNPNWFACLLCFMFLYFCKQMEHDRSKFLLLSLLLFVLFLFQTRFSFLLSCFILPFFVFKKTIWIIFSIAMTNLGVVFISKSFSETNNKIVCFFRSREAIKCSINGYIKGTSAGDFIRKEFKFLDLKTLDAYKTSECHNFLITLLRDCNFIERCIFLTVFFMSFNSSSILFLFYCLTITSPLYFFVAFTFLSTKIKRN